MTMITELPDVAESTQQRYIEVWNEPDVARRHALVDALFAEGIVHRLPAPIDVVSAGRRVGVPHPTFDVVGLDEMRFRVDTAYEEFVAPGLYSFRADGPAGVIGSTVLVRWQMADVATGGRAGGGIDVLTIDSRRRILTDYQFLDP